MITCSRRKKGTVSDGDQTGTIQSSPVRPRNGVMHAVVSKVSVLLDVYAAPGQLVLYVST